MGDLTIGIDIGGTSVRASVVDDRGAMLDTLRAQTPPTAEALEHCLDRLVGELTSRWDAKAVGLAIAGFLTTDRKIVRFAPHLPWREAPVAEEMTRRVGIPVFAEHDANAAAVAEWRFGAAARGHNTVVLAIGTGIGAGFVSYAVLMAARGRAREVHPILWVVAALFVVYFGIDPITELLTG